VEFLEQVVDGPAQAWVEGLARAQNSYTLQQSQILEGRLVISGNEARLDGRWTILAPHIDDDYVTSQFHSVFLHNKVNSVEASKVALYSASIVQQDGEGLVDYLLRFKGQVWSAGLILEDNPGHMIGLIYNGLREYLKKFGYNDKRTGLMFTSVSAFEEFLTEKEGNALRMKSFSGSSSLHTPQRQNALLDPFPDPTSDEEREEDEYWDGMINAVQRAKPRGNRSGQPLAQSRSRPQVVIPRCNNAPETTVPFREVAVFLKFDSPESDWPANGIPFTGPLRGNEEPGAKPPMKDQVLNLLQVLIPKLKSDTAGLIYDKTKVNRDWQWCMLHGSTAHFTHYCPCLKKAYPDRTPEWQVAARRGARQGVNRVHTYDYPDSGEE
jgi:hypothetical protein